MSVNLIVDYVGAVDALLTLLRRYLGRHISAIRIGPVELNLRGTVEASHAETFQKIEAARTHLADAVVALDKLKDQYAAEGDRLEQLLADIAAKRADYVAAVKDRDLAKTLLAADQERLQEVLGMERLRQGKIAGFVGGVLASLLATAVWVWGPVLWKVAVGIWRK